MSKNLVKMAQELNGLVNGFVSEAQKVEDDPDGPTQNYGESARKMLQKKYRPLVVESAIEVLQEVIDKIFNAEEDKCWEEYQRSEDRKKGINQRPEDCPHEPFGYFKIDAMVAVKNGNVSLGFILNKNLRVNLEKNKLFVKLLNAKLPGKYNGKMTRDVKRLTGGNKVTWSGRIAEIDRDTVGY